MWRILRKKKLKKSPVIRDSLVFLHEYEEWETRKKKLEEINKNNGNI